jgi:type II secretory pathway component PulK
MHHSNNKGFVLIYIVSMVVFIAAALVLFQAKSLTFTKRLDVLFKEVDALYMAYSPVMLSKMVIKEDIKNNQYDGIGDNWYSFKKPRSFPVEGGDISLMINDAGAVPDINSLFTGATVTNDSLMPVMQSYFSGLHISKKFVAVLADWVDYGSISNRFGGTEYSPVNGAIVANKNILSPADIRLASGYTEKMEPLLGNAVSYLPSSAPINVNTASPAFLKAIFSDGSARVNHVTSQREREVFVALGDFYESLGVNEPTKAVELGAQTTYFTTQAQITMHGVEKKVESLFERRRGKVILRRLLWN